jgi:hypothetical protein
MITETNAKTPDARLGVVLAILTARFTSPALVLVTAATEEDDTRVLATSSARLVQATGKRAAYVPLVPSQLVSEYRTAGPYTVLHPAVNTLSSPAAFDNAATMWREQYDFLFVDAPTLLSMTLVPHIALTAHGVLVAMRRGRAASARDRDAAAVLKHLGAVTIGVVTTPARLSRATVPSARTADRPLPAIADSDLRTQPIES